MKSKNALRGLAIAVVLHFGVLAATAQNAYSTNADGSANIVAYAGPPWAVTIPTNINGLTVTTIGNDAFENEFSLTSVTIPNSVTTIGENAFNLCSSLTNAT